MDMKRIVASYMASVAFTGFALFTAPALEADETCAIGREATNIRCSSPPRAS